MSHYGNHCSSSGHRQRKWPEALKARDSHTLFSIQHWNLRRPQEKTFSVGYIDLPASISDVDKQLNMQKTNIKVAALILSRAYVLSCTPTPNSTLSDCRRFNPTWISLWGERAVPWFKRCHQWVHCHFLCVANTHSLSATCVYPNEGQHSGVVKREPTHQLEDSLWWKAYFMKLLLPQQPGWREGKMCSKGLQALCMNT